MNDRAQHYNFKCITLPEYTLVSRRGNAREVRRHKLPSPRSRILLKKLIAAQRVNTFPAIYGIRKLIIVFSRARHWIVS
jgi:hypothetical protein